MSLWNRMQSNLINASESLCMDEFCFYSFCSKGSQTPCQITTLARSPFLTVVHLWCVLTDLGGKRTINYSAAYEGFLIELFSLDDVYHDHLSDHVSDYT